MQTLQTANIDINALRNIYRANSKARFIFESLAARQNRRSITTVGSLHSVLGLAGYEIERKEIVAFFKQLENLNCGKYISGYKRGNVNEQSRFVWDVSLVSVGKVATDQKRR
ncbi:MAG TPA: hypothetical protein VN843_33975 [Anaerolineales bacterium]|nr:hypothetical protein [Anaerolineales bacterium]